MSIHAMMTLLAQTADAAPADGISGLFTLIGVPGGIAAVVVGIYRYVVKPELDAGRDLISRAISTSNEERDGMTRLTAALQEATSCAREAAQASQSAASSNERTATMVERQIARLEAIERRPAA